MKTGIPSVLLFVLLLLFAPLSAALPDEMGVGCLLAVIAASVGLCYRQSLHSSTPVAILESSNPVPVSVEWSNRSSTSLDFPFETSSATVTLASSSADHGFGSASILAVSNLSNLSLHTVHDSNSGLDAPSFVGSAPWWVKVEEEHGATWYILLLRPLAFVARHGNKIFVPLRHEAVQKALEVVGMMVAGASVIVAAVRVLFTLCRGAVQHARQLWAAHGLDISSAWHQACYNFKPFLIACCYLLWDKFCAIGRTIRTAAITSPPYIWSAWCWVLEYRETRYRDLSLSTIQFSQWLADLYGPHLIILCECKAKLVKLSDEDRARIDSQDSRLDQQAHKLEAYRGGYNIDHAALLSDYNSLQASVNLLKTRNKVVLHDAHSNSTIAKQAQEDLGKIISRYQERDEKEYVEIVKLVAETALSQKLCTLQNNHDQLARDIELQSKQTERLSQQPSRDDIDQQVNKQVQRMQDRFGREINDVSQKFERQLQTQSRAADKRVDGMKADHNATIRQLNHRPTIEDGDFKRVRDTEDRLTLTADHEDVTDDMEEIREQLGTMATAQNLTDEMKKIHLQLGNTAYNLMCLMSLVSDFSTAMGFDLSQWIADHARSQAQNIPEASGPGLEQSHQDIVTQPATAGNVGSVQEQNVNAPDEAEGSSHDPIIIPYDPSSPMLPDTNVSKASTADQLVPSQDGVSQSKKTPVSHFKTIAPGSVSSSSSKNKATSTSIASSTGNTTSTANTTAQETTSSSAAARAEAAKIEQSVSEGPSSAFQLGTSVQPNFQFTSASSEYGNDQRPTFHLPDANSGSGFAQQPAPQTPVKAESVVHEGTTSSTSQSKVRNPEARQFNRQPAGQAGSRAVQPRRRGGNNASSNTRLAAHATASGTPLPSPVAPTQISSTLKGSDHTQTLQSASPALPPKHDSWTAITSTPTTVATAQPMEQITTTTSNAITQAQDPAWARFLFATAFPGEQYKLTGTKTDIPAYTADFGINAGPNHPLNQLLQAVVDSISVQHVSLAKVPECLELAEVLASPECAELLREKDIQVLTLDTHRQAALISTVAELWTRKYLPGQCILVGYLQVSEDQQNTDAANTSHSGVANTAFSRDDFDHQAADSRIVVWLYNRLLPDSMSRERCWEGLGPSAGPARDKGTEAEAVATSIVPKHGPSANSAPPSAGPPSNSSTASNNPSSKSAPAKTPGSHASWAWNLFLQTIKTGGDAEIIPTDGADSQCGFVAFCLSLEEQCGIRTATLKDMQSTFSGERVQRIMTEFGQTNNGNYSADQIATTAGEWARESAKHVDIFVGWATKDKAGVETAFSQDDYEKSENSPRKTIVVWLYNDNNRAELINQGYQIGSESDNIVQNHWAGLARPWQSSELRTQITVQPPTSLLQQGSSDAGLVPDSLRVAEQDANTSPLEQSRRPSEIGKITNAYDSSRQSADSDLPSIVPQQDDGLAQQLFDRAFPDGKHDFINARKGPGGVLDAICASMAAQHPSVPKSSRPTQSQFQLLKKDSSFSAECNRLMSKAGSDHLVGASFAMKHWSLRHLPGKKVYLCALRGEGQLKTYVTREQAERADAIVVWVHDDQAFATARRAGMSLANAKKLKKNSYKGLKGQLRTPTEAASQAVELVSASNQSETPAASQTPKRSPEPLETTTPSEPPKIEEVHSLPGEMSNGSMHRVGEPESFEEAFAGSESSVDEDDYKMLFDKAFPTGPLIIRNQQDGVGHALQAVIDSISQQHKTLPIPTLTDLLNTLENGLRNKATLYEHQLFDALETWACESHEIIDISLGVRYEVEGQGPDYTIIRSEEFQELGRVVWVQNSNLKDKEMVWSGLKQPLVPAIRRKEGQQKVASGPSGNQDVTSAHEPTSTHLSSSSPQLKTPSGPKPNQNTPRNQSILHAGAESLHYVMEDTVTRQPPEETRPQLAAQRGMQQPEPSTNIQDPDFAFIGSGLLGAFPKPAVEEPAVKEPAVQPESMPVQEYGKTEPQTIGEDNDDDSELSDPPSDMSDTPPFSPVVSEYESESKSEHESKEVRQRSPRMSIRQMGLKKAFSEGKTYGAEKGARNKPPIKVAKSRVRSKQVDEGKPSSKSPAPSDPESEASDDPSRGLRTMKSSLAQSNSSVPLWAQADTHKQPASMVSLTHLDQPLRFDIPQIPPPPTTQPIVPPPPPTQPSVVSPDYQSSISSSFQEDVPMELSPEDFAEVREQTQEPDPVTLTIDPRILSNDWTGLQASANMSTPPSTPDPQLKDLDPATQQKVAKQLDELRETMRKRLAGTATDISGHLQLDLAGLQAEQLPQLPQPAPATDPLNDDIGLDDLEKDVEQSQMIE